MLIWNLCFVLAMAKMGLCLCCRYETTETVLFDLGLFGAGVCGCRFVHPVLLCTYFW